MKKIVRIAILVSFLLVSCSENEGKSGSPDLPIRFLSGLPEQVESRATNNSWEAGDQVGIYMIPHTAEASAAADFSRYTDATNTPYVTSGSGTSVALTVVSGHNAIVYPTDGGKVNFVAYYPYKSDVHTTGGNVYKVDVSNQSPSGAIDLLYHKGSGTAYDRDSEDVALTFIHPLSKMKISLIPDADVEADLSGATVTLSGFPTTADFNLSTGALSNPGGATKSFTPIKDAAASSAGQAVFEAIVVPHDGASYTRNVTFTIGGTAYQHTLAASDGFEAGVAHRYTFTFTGSKIVTMQKDIGDWEGGAITWGNYQLTAGKTSFDLVAGQTSGHTLTLSTNAPSAPVWALSHEANTHTTDEPGWITGVSLSNTTRDENGWIDHTLTFGTNDNVTTVARTGYIRLEMDGLTLAVRVTQAGAALYVNNPVPASFPGLAVTGATNNTFTITTNASDETITVTATNTELITNLTKKRSAVAADGWTIGFDVTENTTTSARSGNIEVTIGGIKKTISVSQVGRYVNNPVPASFPDLAADGVTNNAFILETNSTATVPTSLTTTDSSMITSLTAVRSVKDAAKGIYLWTVTFNVTANKLSSARSATVSITIGGITKTVGVTQLAPWNGPPTDMSDDLTNCYMVAPGGTVTIPITRAITVGGMSASASATVSTLWDDNAVISGSPTLSGSGASRTITVRTTSEPGNAVVALKDASGTIFWSWHVWVVNYNPNTGTTYTINGYMFMDRDIGATRADGNQARGLLYQWGRKDPFPSAISGSAGQAALGSFYIGSYEVTNPDQSAIGIAEGILESIRKPTTFFSFKNFNYYDWLPKNVNTLWNNKTSRSVYDPCPKGWRVADFTNILLTFPYYAKTRQYDTYDETDGPGFGTVTLYGERWHVMIYTPDYIQTCYAAYWTSSAMAIWYLPHRYWSNRGEWARANGLRIRCMQK